MKNAPKVAVLLAVYNGAKYISELLDSLNAQTYDNFTCYIHDDGSKDDTMKICREYADRYPYRFVIRDYPPTGGAKNNFLSLMKDVEEDYIMFCDQDDIWLKDKILRSVEKILETENGRKDVPALVYTDLKITSSDLTVKEESYIKHMGITPEKYNLLYLLHTGIIPGCAFIINKRLLECSMKYQDSSVIYMHDWWVMLVLYLCNGAIGIVNQPLILYRQHEANCLGVVRRNFLQTIIYDFRLIFSGTLWKEKKALASMIKNQAYELSKLPDISDENRKFLNEFHETDSRSKLEKTAYYLKNFRCDKLKFWLIFG